jgi:HK97 family phage prohead protease
MQHLTVKATTTATDVEQGTFTALVSGWVADRQRDVIERSAFDETIRAWRTSGKNLPLLAEHTTTVIGSIDPRSMRATEDGLDGAGHVDRESEEGRAAWRMIKSGVAGYSIGFMADHKPRKGGGRILTSIDLLEISLTATPVHQATRTLGWKSRQPIRIVSFEC